MKVGDYAIVKYNFGKYGFPSGTIVKIARPYQDRFVVVLPDGKVGNPFESICISKEGLHKITKKEAFARLI